MKGQDIHFAQYFNTPLNTNPALTGIFNGDMRIHAHYRHQWYTVEVPYLTFSGSFDRKIYNPRNNKGFWSYGVLFNYDRAGDARLTLMQLGLTGSYTFKFNERHLLTPGVIIGGANRTFDFGRNLQWDSQFQMGMFMETNDPGEPLLADNQSIFYFDAGVGLNYRWQKSSRTHIDVGGGLYHINTPQDAFIDEDDIDLPTRYTANVMTQFQLGTSFDLMINGLAQFQEEYFEVVPAVIGRIYVSQKRGKEFALDVGVIARFTREEADAIAPYIGFIPGNWMLTLSYGITLSEFDIATERYHGPEMSFRYIITRVKPLDNFKNCPIF
jgi:type IX secretion system PorP/SprF family membrane protein